MAASAQEIGFRELTIQSSDGSTRSVPLVENRYSLGRAASNELCYADDSGLSRQHLSIERDGSRWVLRDLGSKNGTFVNGNRLKEPHVIGVGDRITAGHLLLQFGEKSSPLDYTVVFVESAPALIPSTTVGTSLEGLLTDEKEIQGGGHMHALINAGRELAGHKPLNELFELIMNLSIKAVRATRGVLMTLEGEELCVRAATGEGFRISSTVRDSVIKERRSLLVRDARLDQAFADRMSIVQQQ